MANDMTVGVALSGGAARGIAHIGVLQALEELSLPPDVIAGASSGAIVGGFYSMGYTPYEMLAIAKELNYRKHLRLGFQNKGVFQTKRVVDALHRYLGESRFKDLKKLFYVTTVNLNDGEVHYFQEGSLVQPILASCSLPVIFPPVTINDKQYVDGGVLNNLPIEPLQPHCDFIIGVNVNPISYKKNIASFWGIAERTIQLIVRANIMNKVNDCDWVIEPSQLASVSAYDVSDIDRLYQIGYDCVMQDQEEVFRHLSIDP